MKMMNRTMTAMGLALAALELSAAAALAEDAPRQMTIACYAAGIQEYIEGNILPDFEKQYNVKVSYLPGVSLATISKLQAQKDAPQIDVACLDDGPREQAKAMGLLQATDPAKMPNLADVYDVAKMPDNIGVGWAVFGVGIVYNPEAYTKAGLQPPKSWNDLALPELKDHVIADTITSTYGLDLLIMLAKANGGGLDNMEPGFAKMKDVAANVPTFDTTADLSSFFQQGEAWVGVWTNGDDGEQLVPVGKAYFGFTDEELIQIDRFVRRNTVDRFGPVREVVHEGDTGLVLEVAFEGLQRSSRHKSGLAMRFPRINRLRWDKPPREADRLETLETMLQRIERGRGQPAAAAAPLPEAG